MNEVNFWEIKFKKNQKRNDIQMLGKSSSLKTNVIFSYIAKIFPLANRFARGKMMGPRQDLMEPEWGNIGHIWVVLVRVISYTQLD